MSTNHTRLNLKVYDIFSSAVTFKIKERSPKPYQVNIIFYNSCKFGSNPPTSSWDFMHLRKCHADANTDPNANGICTKINMHPSPSVGRHKYMILY